MNAVTKKITIALLALGALLVPASQASAAAAPAWRFDITSVPTNLEPGASFNRRLNSPSTSWSRPTSAPRRPEGPVTITDTLPAGLTLKNARVAAQAKTKASLLARKKLRPSPASSPARSGPGNSSPCNIGFDVDGTGTILHEGDTVTDQAILSGGGAAAAVAENTTEVSSTPAPFDFLPGIPGFGMTPYAEDGTAETQAGGHPHVFSVNLNFSSTRLGGRVLAGADGGQRDVYTYLPHGMIVNPTATPRRCGEVELEAYACPANTQIGVANVLTSIIAPLVLPEPVYNLEPAPGKASNFGFVVVFYPVHIEGGVRPGDYTEMAETRGIPEPAMRSRRWGPSCCSGATRARRPSTTHGRVPSAIAKNPPARSPRQDTAALAMPTSCSETPIGEAEAFSWEHPNGPPAKRSDVMRDANGNEIGITGCAGVEFKPTLKARPTTNVADSPSGLEVDLEVPQTSSLSQRATANLRKAEVTLPEGLVVNPAGANGLSGCSSAQIGIDNATAVPNGNAPACPASSRIGSIEVESALVDHPLPGSVYAATPRDNPFGSLLAIYAVIEDPRAGILVKLPGHVVPDPNTGRLLATFDNNPQLPFSHFKLNFFGGAHGVLRTPSDLRQLLDHLVADPVVGARLGSAGDRRKTTTRSPPRPRAGAAAPRSPTTRASTQGSSAR